VKLVLDAGALLALERNDRAMWRRFKGAQIAGSIAVTHGGVLGQVWRGRGPRQALLAKALESVDVRGLDASLGRATGELLAATGGADVVDAALVLLGEDGDHILTSDSGDIEPLAEAAGCHVEIIPV
jgi:hypothetical protein